MCNKTFWTIAAIACLTAWPRPARAGSDDDTLLQLVKQTASKGQSQETSAQVSAYVDQNKDIISAILNGYMNYIRQIQAMSATDGSRPMQISTTGTGVNLLSDNTELTNAATVNNDGVNPALQTSVAVQPTAAVQTSAPLQTSSLQVSGPLITSHLAGFPSLPDAAPNSALSNPTMDQLLHGAQVQKEMQDRKAYLMAHPEGYTY